MKPRSWNIAEINYALRVSKIFGTNFIEELDKIPYVPVMFEEKEAIARAEEVAKEYDHSLECDLIAEDAFIRGARWQYRRTYL